MKINIIKCHGSDNDFILMDENILERPLQYEERQAITKILCDRQTGVGADGTLFYLASSIADCGMQMFNPDGSEAEMCGNGLRCLGRYGIETLGKENLTVETMKAVLTVEQCADIFSGLNTYEAEISPVSLQTDSLPMNTTEAVFINQPIDFLPDNLLFTAISVPNPHIITLVSSIDEQQVRSCGELCNVNDFFPQGVNVSFVEIKTNNSIFVMTYERGVGITNACGTAMSASAFVAAQNNQADYRIPIKVLNRGGMVVCQVPDPNANPLGSIKLKGNATFVFDACVEINFSDNSFKETDKNLHNHETEKYTLFKQYTQTLLTNSA